MRKITSWILFIIFGCTLWYVGCTFYYHKDLEGKKTKLIKEIHNAIGRDTLYECESIKYRAPIGSFVSPKVIEKYGYSYLNQKYRGCVDGIHHYDLEHWPWLIDKTVFSNNGEYVSYRIVPVTIYPENKLDYFYMDSLLIESYNDYLHNFCPSDVDESDHSSYQRQEEMRRIVDPDPTFDLEEPKNNIPEVDLYKLIVDNNIVILEVTKNTSQLTPRAYILESESKVRKIGCFIVVLLLIIIICIGRKKCTDLPSGKITNILNVVLLVLSITLWGWYYKSFVVVNEKKEIEAQKRLDRLFDEDVAIIYPKIKEAAKISTLFKSLEADVVKDVYKSHGDRYELEENLNKFYNSNHALFIKKIKAEGLTSSIIGSYLHTSKRTGAGRLKIEADIQSVGWTIHALLNTDPSEINEKEDGERYIYKCDSLSGQVFYQVEMLEQDIRKLKNQE